VKSNYTKSLRFVGGAPPPRISEQQSEDLLTPEDEKKLFEDKPIRTYPKCIAQIRGVGNSMTLYDVRYVLSLSAIVWLISRKSITLIGRTKFKITAIDLNLWKVKTVSHHHAVIFYDDATGTFTLVNWGNPFICVLVLPGIFDWICFICKLGFLSVTPQVETERRSTASSARSRVAGTSYQTGRLLHWASRTMSFASSHPNKRLCGCDTHYCKPPNHKQVKLDSRRKFNFRISTGGNLSVGDVRPAGCCTSFEHIQQGLQVQRWPDCVTIVTYQLFTDYGSIRVIIEEKFPQRRKIEFWT
jgi:hypothetical protein